MLDKPFDHAADLKRRGIVYCPDFINNAGGVIRLGGLYIGMSEAEINSKIERIEPRLIEILKNAESMESTYHAALAYARERIDAGVERGQAGPSAHDRVGESTTAPAIRGL